MAAVTAPHGSAGVSTGVIPDASVLRRASEVRCALCGRVVPKRLITLHHLKPKSRGGGAEVRVPTCRPCHKMVHATFTNKQLDHDYADLDKLRRAHELQPFLAFIRKQKPDRNVSVKVSGNKRRRK